MNPIVKSLLGKWSLVTDSANLPFIKQEGQYQYHFNEKEVVMKKVILLTLVVSMFLMTGCGKEIFKSDFGFNGNPYFGNPPSNSNAQRIITFQPTNPNGSGGELVFNSFTSGKTYFVSRPISNSREKKSINIYFRLNAGNGPFDLSISAKNLPEISNALTSWFKLRVVNNVAQLYSKSPTNQNEVALGNPKAFNQQSNNHVIIILNAKTNTYSVSIGPKDGPKQKWSGGLNPAFINMLKTKSRLVMEAKFNGAMGTNEYRMDRLVMREK